MYLAEARIESILQAVSDLHPGREDALLILLGEKNKPDIPGLIAALKQKKVHFAGGFFPGLIQGTRKHESGAVIVSLPVVEKPFLIRGLEKDKIELPNFGKRNNAHANARHTALVLVDGFAANISGFLAELFGVLGNTVHYFGGGAGSASLKQEPCLFTSEGFFQNAAIVLMVKLASALGVRHGWERLGSPVVATRTRRNVLVELNWRPAFDVYRDIVDRDSGKKITAKNFYSIARGYPFGILKEGAEDVVRDPFSVTEKNELVCFGAIPENTVLNILKGRSTRLIQAAGQAVGDCVDACKSRVRFSLVVDCISRGFFLEEGFTQELERVAKKIQSVESQQTLEGVLTFGEIASCREGVPEFLNKTIVVNLLQDAQ